LTGGLRRRRLEERFLAPGQARWSDHPGELLANLSGRYFLHGARRQLGEQKRPKTDADQAVDGQTERVEHAANLAVLAFGEGESEPDVGRRRTVANMVAGRLDRSVANALDRDAVPQSVEPRLLDAPEDPGAITPPPATGGQFQGPGQLAIVGEQEQAFGGDIQAAHGDQARQARRQGVEHRRAAPGVAVCGHQTDGLVIAEEPRRVRRRHDLAVNGQSVRRPDPDRGRGEDFAVQGDPAGGDHALDFAPGGDAGSRERLGDTVAAARGLTAALGLVSVRGMSDHDVPTMRIALEEAQAAAMAGEVPVGAAIIDPIAGEILARAANGPVASHDPTAHAEILCLRAAARRLGNYRLTGLTLVATLEPCAMCAGAISHARIGRLVFGAADEKGGAVINGPRWFEQPTCHWKPHVTGGVMALECAALLRNFFQARR